MTRLTTLNLPAFHRATIGFDRMFNDLEAQFESSQSNGYPPYNIVQINDDEYMISLAVAGFGMDDLDITKEGNLLRVEGKAPKPSNELVYLHKGIAGRNFRREFTLADHMEIVNANHELGMLNIHIVREVPEELQPKKIAINSGDSLVEVAGNYDKI